MSNAGRPAPVHQDQAAAGFVFPRAIRRSAASNSRCGPRYCANRIRRVLRHTGAMPRSKWLEPNTPLGDTLPGRCHAANALRAVQRVRARESPPAAAPNMVLEHVRGRGKGDPPEETYTLADLDTIDRYYDGLKSPRLLLTGTDAVVRPAARRLFDLLLTAAARGQGDMVPVWIPMHTWDRARSRRGRLETWVRHRRLVLPSRFPSRPLLRRWENDSRQWGWPYFVVNRWLAQAVHDRYGIPYPLAVDMVTDGILLPFLTEWDTLSGPQGEPLPRDQVVDLLTQLSEAQGFVNAPVVIAYEDHDGAARPTRPWRVVMLHVRAAGD